MLKVIKSVIKGFGDTTVHMTPLTAIIKVFKNVKNLNKIKSMLDVNKDGKINIDDLKGLKWETIGNVLAIIAGMAALIYFGII